MIQAFVMKNGIWTKTPQHQRVIDFCYKHRRFLNTVVWKDKQNLGGGGGEFTWGWLGVLFSLAVPVFNV